MTYDKSRKQLIVGLKMQIKQMEANADYLYKLYPDLGHHVELRGAAKITQNWLDNIDI